jgi:hypothetical protein
MRHSCHDASSKVFGKKVAVGSATVFGRGFRVIFGTEGVPDLLEVLFGFEPLAFGIVFPTNSFGTVIAILLHPLDLGIDAGEVGEAAVILLRVGSQKFRRLRAEEEFGKTHGGKLKAEFGEFGGVVAAEKREHVVLVEAKGDGLILGHAPFPIAAAGFPVGDVAPGDFNADLLKRANDSVVRDIIAEHAIYHIAVKLWQPRDLAVAGSFGGRGVTLH